MFEGGYNEQQLQMEQDRLYALGYSQIPYTLKLKEYGTREKEINVDDVVKRYSIPFFKEIVRRFFLHDCKDRRNVAREINAYKKIYGQSLLNFKHETLRDQETGDEISKYTQVLNFED